MEPTYLWATDVDMFVYERIYQVQHKNSQLSKNWAFKYQFKQLKKTENYIYIYILIILVKINAFKIKKKNNLISKYLSHVIHVKCTAP